MPRTEVANMIAADIDAEERFRQAGNALGLSWLHLYRFVSDMEGAEGRGNRYYTDTLLGLIDRLMEARDV